MQLLHGNHRLFGSRYSPKAPKNCVAQTKAIEGLKALPNVTELKSFLGICNVFRRTVATLSRIAFPLNQNLRKDQRFNFKVNKKELEAMKKLQEKVISSLVLPLPCAEEQMKLDSNARHVRVGCVLLQERSEKTTKPIGFWSIFVTSGCTVRRNKNVLPLHRLCYFLQLTSMVHELQSEPITSH